LTFFSILHVPLNVPALAVSVNEDNLDTDRELLAHGISNILAGLAGSVPNYLCYVNSVLFYRVGGGSRLSGLMLAGATFVVFLSGPGAIGYLPICVVGALIFVLGIDLTKEAVWDTIGRVNSGEYVTIWIIIFVMTYYDFVVGIITGIIVACLFFVIQTSRRRTVRAVLDGSIARSTVRRHTTQRQFLDEVGQQTQVVKLQGFLYFANISGVEELIRKGLDIATWQEHPIRFLIVDFSLVSGVDFSAAEAFTRIQRLLHAKDVVLVFCGLTPNSEVGIALRSVDLWTDSSVRVEVFQSLNEALEWTENEYLRGMYSSGSAAAKSFTHASLVSGGGLNIPEGGKRKPAFHLNETMENSPRRQHLYQAAQEATRRSNRLHDDALGSGPSAEEENDELPTKEGEGESQKPSSNVLKMIQSQPQPLPLLMITFQAYADEAQHNQAFYQSLVPFFKEIRLSKGEVVWRRDEVPDGLYLIESGILKARYDFPQEDYEINEAMLAGTIAGELSFLSKRPRNTTAYAELDCKLWKLDAANLLKLKEQNATIFNDFLQLLLRACTEEQEGLMSYLVSRLS
jgi:SulP family sulfate permease